MLPVSAAPRAAGWSGSTEWAGDVGARAGQVADEGADACWVPLTKGLRACSCQRWQVTEWLAHIGRAGLDQPNRVAVARVEQRGSQIRLQQVCERVADEREGHAAASTAARSGLGKIMSYVVNEEV